MKPTWRYCPIPCTTGPTAGVNIIVLQLGHTFPKCSAHTLASTKMRGMKPLYLTSHCKRPARFNSSMDSSGSINGSSEDFSMIVLAKSMSLIKWSLKRGRVAKSVDLVGKFRWVREVIIFLLTRMRISATSSDILQSHPCFRSVRKSLARLQRLAVPILLPALAKTLSPG